MPTSATGTCNRPAGHAAGGQAPGGKARRCGGFTLIEILVVVVIMAVMVAVAVVSLSGLDGRHLEREAERFSALLHLACEQSELSGRELGIHLATTGYGFTMASAQGWLPFPDDHRFRVRELDGVALQLADGALLPDRPDFQAPPQVLCWPSAELSALDLRFLAEGATAGTAARLRVRTGADALPWVELRDEANGWQPLAARR